MKRLLWFIAKAAASVVLIALGLLIGCLAAAGFCFLVLAVALLVVLCIPAASLFDFVLLTDFPRPKNDQN